VSVTAVVSLLVGLLALPDLLLVLLGGICFLQVDVVG
jgi:hypothetical protein